MSVIEYVVVNEDGTREEGATGKVRAMLKLFDSFTAEVYLEGDCVGRIEVKEHELPRPGTFARQVTYYPEIAYQGQRFPVRAVLPAVGTPPEVSIDDLSHWVLFNAVRQVEGREMAIFQASKVKVLKKFLQQAATGGVENVIVVDEVPEELKQRILAAEVAFDRYMLAMGWDEAPSSETLFEIAVWAWLEQLNAADGVVRCEDLEHYLHGCELKAQMMFVKRLMDAEDAAQDALPEFLEVEVEDYSVEFRDCEFGETCFVDPDLGAPLVDLVEPWSGSAWDVEDRKILDIEYGEAEGHDAQAQVRLLWPGMEQRFFVRSEGAENEDLLRKLIAIEKECTADWPQDMAFMRAMYRVWMEYMVEHADELAGTSDGQLSLFDSLEEEDCEGACGL